MNKKILIFIGVGALALGTVAYSSWSSRTCSCVPAPVDKQQQSS
jgi:hypothetical protein